MRFPILLLFAGVIACVLNAAEQNYQKPPKEVLDVLNAPVTPRAYVSPSKTHVLLADPLRYPPIADLAQPMLRLAGIRINPKTNGPHRGPSNTGLVLKRVGDGTEVRIAGAGFARLSAPRWSPDGSRFAFTNTTENGIELWIGETSTGHVRKVDGVRVNAFMARPSPLRMSDPVFQWMTGGKALLVQTVPAGRGNPPAEAMVPVGPTVQETAGKAGPVPTYEDLLANPRDEALFDYYAAAQLVLVDAASGRVTPIGQPAIYPTVSLSPDGGHVLVARTHRPYSYLHPLDSFPKDVEVWDRSGKMVFSVAKLPLADRVPLEGVPVGPRGFEWRPNEPATLFWVEAMDGGNPKEKVPHRDRILMAKAPFQGAPAEVFQTEQRFRGLQFTEDGKVAFIEDYERMRRWQRTFVVNPDRPGSAPRTLFSRNVQDRYKDPGQFVMEHEAIQVSKGGLFLTGPGASPNGDHPFLDRMDLETGKPERLFQSEPGVYETFVAMLDDEGKKILTLRESAKENPNYFIRTLGPGGGLKAFTSYPNPTPQLMGITKQLVKYTRPDGVPLSFTLYLPAGYQAGTRLPTVVWAYPLEYNDADTAGQVSGSTDRFTTIAWPSLQLLFALRGYAVLDGAAMPVVGNPETVNNTYLEQIVADAKAAIDKAVEMGVTDRSRVGVGGHSYGAFMTANLLAHSDLFKAGIARSGAYNRTLTPFGFQSERRTIWESPDVYLKMSPFLSANHIKAPILFTHGEADDNTGTFPIQSERMYAAVRGNGGIARLVMLPHEAHGYQARESIEHLLHEMLSWFDKWVKGE